MLYNNTELFDNGKNNFNYYTETHLQENSRQSFTSV